MHEFRSLTHHPKYKMELCRTFYTIDFYLYRPHCHFTQNAEELRKWLSRGSGTYRLTVPASSMALALLGFAVLPPPPLSRGCLTAACSSPHPTILNADNLLASLTLPDGTNNPFAFSSQELASLFAPSMGLPGGGSPTTFLFRPMSESPHMFDSPPSPQDSLSDQEGYLSSSSSSHSGSDSPTLDNSRRLPIFSRLSISDD